MGDMWCGPAGRGCTSNNPSWDGRFAYKGQLKILHCATLFMCHQKKFLHTTLFPGFPFFCLSSRHSNPQSPSRKRKKEKGPGDEVALHRSFIVVPMILQIASLLNEAGWNSAFFSLFPRLVSHFSIRLVIPKNCFKNTVKTCT